MCESLPYTQHDNCNAASTFPDGTVTVASAAARYNPVFYWLIGKPAQPFEGAAAMYVMRAMSALLCSLFLAGAAWAVMRWARTVWPMVSLVLVLTPVTIYSTAVAAPNGLEMLAAAGAAVTLLALPRVRHQDLRMILGLACVFASTLAVLRGLGPLFLLCIGVMTLQVVGPRRLFGVLRQVPGTATAAAAVVLVCTLAGAWWTMSAGSMELEDANAQGNPLVDTLTAVPLWFFQSIAAFPLRNEPADPIVYAAGIVVLGGFLVLALRRGTRRGRIDLLVTFGIALVVPVALQTAVYETSGDIWQGRYGWPISLVVLIVAGLNLEDWHGRSKWTRPLLLAGAAAWTLAHTWSTVALVVKEQAGGVYVGDSRWVTAPPVVIAALTIVGCLFWYASVRESRSVTTAREASTAPQEPDLLSL
jgi:hypothetical protein